MSELQNQVAIVTGASRGIGKRIALTLAERGACVIACGRDEAKLNQVLAEASGNECPGRIVVKPFDIAERAAVDTLVDDVSSAHERIDIVVNNAGITRDGLLMNMEDDQFDDVLTTNLRAVFWMTRAVSRLMVRARKGRIINISSVSGVMGNAGQANYAASKAGVIGFSKSVAKELAKRGITCNVVAPGFVETEMTASLSEEVKKSYQSLIPLRRFGTADDVASVVAFLAGAGGAYVTGQVLVVDGGLCM